MVAAVRSVSIAIPLPASVRVASPWFGEEVHYIYSQGLGQPGQHANSRVLPSGLNAGDTRVADTGLVG